MAVRRDVLVYLSGPISPGNGKTVETNVAVALAAYLECVKRGIPAICPHLSGAFPSAWQIPWGDWLAYDLAMVDRCTHVWMLPGWQGSEGARMERAYAEAAGTPVIGSLEELPDEGGLA